MKSKETRSDAVGSPTATYPVATPTAENPAQLGAPGADHPSMDVDRPGFDQGGSSGETRAGSGLGLGEDAFDTPGDRRLPGRRVDADLTIPRWSGPKPSDPTFADRTTAGVDTPPKPAPKKAR